ncbi:hypothetical protein GAMM_260006 [Gammaproteobacteria bacterium]
MNQNNKISDNNMPNGHFKQNMYSFGLCFSWVITIFCLLFGEAQNAIHMQLAIYSFVAGIAFVFGLVFKQKLNLPWLLNGGGETHNGDGSNKNDTSVVR